MGKAGKYLKQSLVLLIAVIVVFIIGFIVFSSISDDDMTVEGQPTLNEYNVDIDIDKSGAAYVVETHKLNFEERDRPWWNYYKILATGKDVLNVDRDSFKVYVDGVEYPMWLEELDFDDRATQYNKNIYVGHSYVNTAYNSKFEVGVVLSDFVKGNREIEISYRLNKVLIENSDVASFYYQLTPSNNSVPIRKMTANIKFPENSEDNLYFYLHVDNGRGGIRKNNNSHIEIEADKIPAKMYVETRITLDKHFDTYAKIDSSVGLESIKSEELEWYNEFLDKQRKEKMILIVDIVVAVAVLSIAIGYSVRTFKKRRVPKVANAPEYEREPIDGYTFEEAMPLYYYYSDRKEKNWWSDTISATIMSLFKKKRLTILPSQKKKDAEITVINVNEDGLTEYEKIILKLLCKVGKDSSFTMKEFEKYVKSHSESVFKEIESYKDEARSKTVGVRPGKIRQEETFVLIFTIIAGFMIAMFSLMGANVLFGLSFVFTGIAVIIAAILSYAVKIVRPLPLMPKGQEDYVRIDAFGKYMLDFSNFAEKDIPDLTIWEDYLIWATAMGIADQVSKQLSIVYPEFARIYESDYSPTNTFLFWYFFAPRIRVNMNFDVTRNMMSVTNSLEVARSIAKANEIDKKFGGGGGFGHGGGGFSGGGGGFGGGGGMGAR